MSDLTDFLTERLDDDEAWAKAGLDAEWPEFNEPGTPGHHARVLADVAAKRRIVEEYLAARDHASRAHYAGELGEAETARLMYAGMERALRHHAAVYVDHPDYRPEWRP